MRTSSVRIVRKLAGYMLLIVNLILSVVSALAFYSVVEFASNSKNYNFIPGPSNDGTTLTAPVPYLYIGNVTFNNTGIFDFDDFSVDFELNDTVERLMSYQGWFGDIKAGQKREIKLNLTTATMPYPSSLWIKDGLSGLSPSMNFSASLKISGKYVLSLFSFVFRITNVTELAFLP